MYMEDEKGIDSKVVLSPVARESRPRYQLTVKERETIAEYFRKYKRDEPGKFSKVPGWGSIGEGREHVTTTRAFFENAVGVLANRVASGSEPVERAARDFVEQHVRPLEGGDALTRDRLDFREQRLDACRSVDDFNPDRQFLRDGPPVLFEHEA